MNRKRGKLLLFGCICYLIGMFFQYKIEEYRLDFTPYYILGVERYSKAWKFLQRVVEIHKREKGIWSI